VRNRVYYRSPLTLYLMEIALVSSAIDPAGTGIHREIRRILSTGEMQPGDGIRFTHHEIPGRLIHADGIDRDIAAEIIIFLSRHASTRPVPVLTVHATGNFSDAQLGGIEGSLAPSAPGWMHAVLRKLAAQVPPGYHVTYEATHHGPTELSTPSFFVEIGSTEREWADEAAHRAAARGVLSASPGSILPVIGFGGTHYATRQTEIALHTPVGFGHILPARCVPEVTAAMVGLMVERSGAMAGYIDRKSLTPALLGKTEGLLRESGLPVLRSADCEALNRISPEILWEIRKMVDEMPVMTEYEIGGINGQGSPEYVTVDDGLLGAADAAAGRELRRAFRTLPIVMLIDPKGAMLPGFIVFREERAQVLHDLIALCVTLIRRNEETAIAGDDLIIRKRRFDPGSARRLGIPPGPLYARLSAGEAISAGDRVITPDMVQSVATQVIHIPGLEKYL
jgi:D-aminoacyl-tRNA deacylase